MDSLDSLASKKNWLRTPRKQQTRPIRREEGFQEVQEEMKKSVGNIPALLHPSISHAHMNSWNGDVPTCWATVDSPGWTACLAAVVSQTWRERKWRLSCVGRRRSPDSPAGSRVPMLCLWGRETRDREKRGTERCKVDFYTSKNTHRCPYKKSAVVWLNCQSYSSSDTQYAIVCTRTEVNLMCGK